MNRVRVGNMVKWFRNTGVPYNRVSEWVSQREKVDPHPTPFLYSLLFPLFNRNDAWIIPSSSYDVYRYNLPDKSNQSRYYSLRVGKTSWGGGESSNGKGSESGEYKPLTAPTNDSFALSLSPLEWPDDDDAPKKRKRKTQQAADSFTRKLYSTINST